MEVSDQLHAPASLLPGKEALVYIWLEKCGPLSPSGRAGKEKNSCPDGNRTPVVQPFATYVMYLPYKSSWPQWKITDEKEALNSDGTRKGELIIFGHVLNLKKTDHWN
jgi:hypothetical protein